LPSANRHKSDVQPLGYATVVVVENIGKKLKKATNDRLSV